MFIFSDSYHSCPRTPTQTTSVHCLTLCKQIISLHSVVALAVSVLGSVSLHRCMTHPFSSSKLPLAGYLHIRLSLILPPPTHLILIPILSGKKEFIEERSEIEKTVTSQWRRQWHPTPVLLPGKSHGRRSLVGCSPWGREESDTTEAT